MIYLCYCAKCGRIVSEFDDGSYRCDVCGYKLKVIPSKYHMKWPSSNEKKYREGEKRLIKELIKASPEFDIDLFNKRDDILEKANSEYDAVMKWAKEKKENIPRCPTCGSTDLKKGSFGGTATNYWGAGFDNTKKMFKCKNCGYKW